MSGIIVVDKPQGLSSHSVVSMARRSLGTRKVGHAGTLDPMATGVLVLGVNSATRLLTFLVGEDKTYEATIRLGSSTVTDDAEGETLFTADTAALKSITDDHIASVVRGLTGDIHQRPSSVSAIKVAGQRAYNLVRGGEEVELPERPVRVSRFDVMDIRRDPRFIDVDVEVDCSSGTYIRALARDAGDALGVGGHLTRLRRTRVGHFTLDSAVTPEALSPAAVIPSSEMARMLFPTWELTSTEARDLRHGKRIPVDISDSSAIAAIREGVLVAVVSVSQGIARVETGFPDD